MTKQEIVEAVNEFNSKGLTARLEIINHEDGSGTLIDEVFTSELFEQYLEHEHLFLVHLPTEEKGLKQLSLIPRKEQDSYKFEVVEERPNGIVIRHAKLIQ